MISPDVVDNFPDDLSPISDFHISQFYVNYRFNLVKSQLSHGLYPLLYFLALNKAAVLKEHCNNIAVVIKSIPKHNLLLGIIP